MNENSKRLRALEAENRVVCAKKKDLENKVDTLATSTTLPPGFGHVRYEVNPTPDLGQATPAMLTFNTCHPIFELRSSAIDNPAPEGDQTIELIAPDATTMTTVAQGEMSQQAPSITKAIVPLTTLAVNMHVAPALHTTGTARSTSILSDPELACRFAEMEALIQHILEMPDPIKKNSINCFTDSLFIDAIVLIEMPKKFNFPKMKQYDSMTDLDDHIAQYLQCMFIAAIPRDLREAFMCKGFKSSLVDLVL
ncbi:hypothetical protein ACOSQ3_019020 [Xanthoceras sorbifolium]